MYQIWKNLRKQSPKDLQLLERNATMIQVVIKKEHIIN